MPLNRPSTFVAGPKNTDRCMHDPIGNLWLGDKSWMTREYSMRTNQISYRLQCFMNNQDQKKYINSFSTKTEHELKFDFTEGSENRSNITVGYCPLFDDEIYPTLAECHKLLHQGADFIHKAVTTNRSNCYVHCESGVSRSCKSLLIAL